MNPAQALRYVLPLADLPLPEDEEGRDLLAALDAGGVLPAEQRAAFMRSHRARVMWWRSRPPSLTEAGREIASALAALREAERGPKEAT